MQKGVFAKNPLIKSLMEGNPLLEDGNYKEQYIIVQLKLY